ncbi:MAG TPA: DUF29 domain-containing protein [Geminicoccaceae bacterium]|nr:DUF29 domain-containing protein [Geminicoccaceae bacterium]
MIGWSTARSAPSCSRLSRATSKTRSRCCCERRWQPSRPSFTTKTFTPGPQAQAKALRTHFRGDNRIDVEHLAEEVKDLGSSELQAVESFVERIIAHLLELDYSAQDAPRPYWRAEVLNFRRNVARKASPAIRRKVESELDVLYGGGRQIAAIGTLPHEPDLARRLPKARPYDWDAVWRRDVMAEAGIDLSGGGEGAKKPRRKRGA